MRERNKGIIGRWHDLRLTRGRPGFFLRWSFFYIGCSLTRPHISYPVPGSGSV